MQEYTRFLLMRRWTVHDTNLGTDHEIMFQGRFVESGLVTQAELILSSLYKFFSSGDLLQPKRANKGKSTSNHSEAFSEAGLLTAKECFEYRNYQSCLRLVQLLVEKNVLSAYEGDLSISQKLIDLGHDSVQAILQNVSPFHTRC
jgi:hypothetical protein